MGKYLNKEIEALSAELSGGLVRLRKGYVDAAESLIQMIDPELEYPFEFVVFRMTGCRPARPKAKPLLMQGKDLSTDLARVMLDLSESFKLNVSDYSERVYDTTSLAMQFDVSTKTIRRWRTRGLPARMLVFPDGKKHPAFLDSSVRWFVHERRKKVTGSMKFKQMTSSERDDIIRRARRISEFTRCNMSEIAKRLASKTGRSPETIRYTIRKHDTEHPAAAIFPKLAGPLDEQERAVIYRAFFSGVPIAKLAKKYKRTRGSIYRVINETRAKQLLGQSIDFIPSEEFDQPGADKKILAPEIEASGKKRRKKKSPSDTLPPYLIELYNIPLLVAEQEADLFRRYNYLKYKADRLRQKIDLKKVRTSLLKEIESLMLAANVLKNRIVRANLRLVVSIAKKHTSGPLSLFELISEGNVSLMRAVDKFDYSRGYRFSTYSSWAIMRSFARSVPKEKYQLDRFSTGREDIMDLVGGLADHGPRGLEMADIREGIDSMLSLLSPREKIILTDHYGLDDFGKPKTFDQIGKNLGISKERVRQIELKAFRKLRKLGKENRIP